MGLVKMTSNSLTQVNLHKTNKQVGLHKVVTPLVLRRATGNLGLTRLITARIRGKPPPSPMQYTLHLRTRVASEWLFVLGFPNGSPKITKVGSPTTLWDYNVLCRPPIRMRFKLKLQPSLRVFQQRVTCHLHIKESGRFPTFRGRESNYRFDFRPFFWP